MLLFQSNGNLKLLLILIIFFLNYSLIISEDINLGDGDYKVIFISKKIIYIINSEDDYNIYRFDEDNKLGMQIGNYTNIKNNKDIIKIDEDSFLIIGFDEKDNFRCMIYYYQLSNLYNQSDFIIDVKNTNILKYNFKCISNKICFLTFTSNTDFNIFKIDLSSGKSSPYPVPEDIDSIDQKKNIQCDFSNDGEIFLCILSLIRNGKWINKYYYGNSNNCINSGEICQNNINCLLGNVKKIDDSLNKYIICYEAQNSDSSIINIKCQYYYLKDNINDEKSIDLCQLPSGYIGINDRELIIQLYENSLIIVADFKMSQNKFGYIFVSSLDLKITTQISAIVSNEIRFGTTYFFNDDDNNYYILFYSGAHSSATTTIRKVHALVCLDKEYIISGGEESIIVDLFNDQDDKTNVHFSLDPSIALYKISEGKGSMLNFTGNNGIEIDKNSNYSLNKTTVNGIFNNYYGFSLGAYFSLICRMKVIICYKTCKNCSSEIIGTSINNSCSKCEENYFPIYSEKENNKNSFNCYSSTDEKISNFYLDNLIYYPCNDSCKSCNNSHSCNLCKEGYYFKAYENGTINFEEKCMNFLPPSYYLDSNFNKIIQNETIKIVFKPCYETCQSCTGHGTYEANLCTSCKEGYMQYKFNEQQCTFNYSKCLDNHTYWRLEGNKIECIEKCDKRFVISGINVGQCVDFCENYTNPFSIQQNSYLLPYECNGTKYCIPFSDCYKGSFYLSEDGKKCERKKRCIKINIFDKDQDPFEIEPEEEFEEEVDPIDIDQKIEEMNKRLKIIKMLNENKEDSQVLKDFNDLNIINKYYELVSNEKKKHYLVASTKYVNFTNTIYPLDIENYTYNQLILPNNFGFVNFTKMYPNFINYEINTNNLILVCILESHNEKSSIKDINYYLYSFNEKNQSIVKRLGKKIKMNEKNELLLNESSQLELQYPLYSYVNKSSLVNKRNSENLVENIKYFNEKYPEVELYNLADPFYNDICFLFTSDKGTDMTLNDRRNEYYVNISLCEDNCTLIKVINKGSKPRAVCNCDIKYDLSFSKNKGLKDKIISYSVQNSKSFICISETFNFNLKKNGNFWFFIFILIFQLYLLINYIKYRDNIVNTMLGLFDNNAQINKDLIMSSSDGSNFVYEYKNNDIEKNYQNKINNSDDKNLSNLEEIVSAPVNVSNPPKKNIDQKRANVTFFVIIYIIKTNIIIILTILEKNTNVKEKK
jgi:hypothetical protein